MTTYLIFAALHTSAFVLGWVVGSVVRDMREMDRWDFDKYHATDEPTTDRT